MDWSVLPDLLLSLVQLAVVIVALILVLRLLIKQARKHTEKKAQEQAFHQWQQMKAGQETVDYAAEWICKTCGALNHNREVCEHCGGTDGERPD